MPAPALRPESILRERVLSELDAAARRPLTVICAPAGYGKTSALVQWLEHAGIAYAWLSLDAHDNDPQRFATRLLAALDRALPGRFEAARRALAAGADLREGVIPMVVKALDGMRLAVVLDDYHVVSATACHRVARELLDAVPAGVSMVVASRTVPPLGLRRRRAAGTVSELGPEQLRFDIEDSERLLNGSLRLGLDRAQIEQIDARVHGWPVALGLIASAIAGRSDRAAFLDALARSRAHLGAYLTEEVLDATRPELQDFLRRTSILNRLSAPLCEAVLDDPRAGELLEEVRRMNLFVTALDDEWVRYHPVFAEALEAELHRRQSPLVAELHRRTSVWFEQAGMPDEGIEHALLAGDGPRAAALLARSWLALIDARRYATLRGILDRLPDDRGEFGPLCEGLELLCMTFEGVDSRVVNGRARALAQEHGDDPDLGLLFDELLIDPWAGDVGRALEVARQAWERYSDAPEARLQLAPMYGITLWWAGESEAARTLLEPLVGVDQPTTRKVWTLSALAAACADAGDLDRAERYGREAMSLVEEISGQTATEFGAVPGVLAEVLRRRGELDEARRYMDRMLENEARRPGSPGHAHALVFDAQLALAAGDRRRAHTTARRARAIVDRYRDLGAIETRLRGVESALRGPAENPLLGTAPSRAELRVLVLLDSERTLSQIAAELYLSIATVKSHTHRLYRRFGVTARDQAVTAARERGLLSTHPNSDG